MVIELKLLLHQTNMGNHRATKVAKKYTKLRVLLTYFCLYFYIIYRLTVKLNKRKQSFLALAL